MKCAFCSIEFEPTSKTQKFCSKKCAKASSYHKKSEEKKAKQRERGITVRGDKVKATCAICGSKFEYIYNNVIRTCCSSQCVHKSYCNKEKERMKEQMTVKNNIITCNDEKHRYTHYGLLQAENFLKTRESIEQKRKEAHLLGDTTYMSVRDRLKLKEQELEVTCGEENI